MKYALIENGFVKQIVNAKFPFAETDLIFFVEYDDNLVTVKEGFSFIDGVFINPNTPEKIKQDTISLIKSEANRRITSAYPEWKQRNHMAAVAEIHNKELIALKANTIYTLSADELVIVATAQAAKTEIFNIRAKSDELEASLDTMTQEQLEAFDATNDSNWV